VEKIKFRRRLTVIAGLAALAQALFLWTEWHGNPFAQLPVEDAQVYWDWAARIADGHWVSETPFLSAPLYPFFLGILRTIGLDLPGVYVVQALCHVGTLILIALIGRLRFGPAAGITAAVFFLLLPEAAYMTGRTLNGSLQLLTIAALLYGAVRTQCKPWNQPTIKLGALAGIATLANPTLLIALPFLAWWLGRGKILRFLATAAICIAPATVHNYLAVGEFIPISAQAGVTFVHGNAPGAHGIYQPIPGISAGRLQQNADAFETARAATGISSWSNTSSYFLRRGLGWMMENPGAAAGLLAKKMRWFFLGQNYGDVYLPQLEKQNGISGLPFFLFLPLVFLLPLAFLGAFRLWRADGRRALPELLLFLLPIVVVFIFWYSPRYRLPIIPPAVLLAAWALTRTPPRFYSVPGILLGALAWLLPAWVGFDSPQLYRPQFEHSLGSTLRVLQKPQLAIPHLQRAIELGYDQPATHYHLAQAHMALENWDDAVAELKSTTQSAPNHQEAWENLGAILAWQKDLVGARTAWLEALHLAEIRNDQNSIQRIQQRLLGEP
jgi:4-amino-4-deoxy-L-arabinose transferase-like glycosyltransferase